MVENIRDRISKIIGAVGVSSPAGVYAEGVQLGYNNWHPDTVAMAMRAMARDGLLNTDGVHYSRKPAATMEELCKRRQAKWMRAM